MSIHEKIKQYFNNNYEDIKTEVIELVKEFVKEKTVNVPSSQLSSFPFLKNRGEEYKVAEKVKEKLNEYNVNYDEYARIKERPNIIARLGRNSSKKLLFAAHMDVVPAGDNWDTSPYEVVEKEGKLYGRGTSDNKGQLASIIVASKILKSLGLDKELNGELEIAALADEEAKDPDGIDYGIGYLLDNEYINPDYSVIPDIGQYMKNIDVAEKGRTSIKIKSIGKQAHGSTPHKGINAINKMSEAIQRIKNIKLDYQEHPLLNAPTLNIGIISGGAAANIVPGTCELYLDMRTVPGMTQESIKQDLQNAFKDIENGNFEISFESWKPPHAIKTDNYLVKSIQKLAPDILGFTPQPIGMGGGTYAKILSQHGTLAVGWGIGNEDTFHVANEYIEIDQLMDFSLLTCLLAVEILK